MCERESVCVWVCWWVCGCVYVYVCVSAIEIQTTELISMKFGIGILLNERKVCSWVATPYPYPHGQGGPKWGLVPLCILNRSTWWKLYKTEVVVCPWFNGGRYNFQIPNLDPEGPGPRVLLEPWSIIFRQSFLNKSWGVPSQYLTWSGLNLLALDLTLDPRSGCPKWGQGGSAASNIQLGKNFTKQKWWSIHDWVGA